MCPIRSGARETITFIRISGIRSAGRIEAVTVTVESAPAAADGLGLNISPRDLRSLR